MAKTVTKLGNAAANLNANDAFSMKDVIRGEQNIKNAVHNFGVQNRSHHRNAHLVAVSAMIHVAENGQPAILNAFYDTLTEMQKRSFRDYVIRHCAYSDQDKFDKGLGAGPAGWLKWDNKSQAKPMAVIANKEEPKAETKPSERREAWVRDVAPKLIAATEKGYLSWFAQDPRKTVNQDALFSTDDFLAGVERLFQKATKEGKSAVSGQVIQLFRQTLENAKTYAENEAELRAKAEAEAAKAEASGETGTMPPVPTKAEATQPATKH